MTEDIDRRRFLKTAGAGVFGVAIFGIAACTSSEQSGATPSTSQAASSTTATTAATTTTATVVSTTVPPVTDLVTSKRVDLGFVSVYIVDRGDGLVVVDTGVGGSAAAIQAVVEEYGRSWADVGYVIATHDHPDHVGSLNAVLALATDADVFAGVLDAPGIGSDRPIIQLSDGDVVNGVEVIATPGHTKGHISLLDPDVGLFCGDAINGADGGVVGPNPRFTSDLAAAGTSVVKLATYTFEQIFFGHGEPVLSGGSAAVRELADSL